MTKITFIDRKNNAKSISVADNGDTDGMRAAVSHGIKGIVAECGRATLFAQPATQASMSMETWISESRSRWER